MPIPNFDHNLVLPPHLGDPTDISQLSPYSCTTIDLCSKFATSPERIAILTGFLRFRDRLNNLGLVDGYQWLDGSFLEDIENQEGRAPRDLDVVTIYYGYDLPFQDALLVGLPEFGDPILAKQTYSLDHYPFDAGYAPINTVEMSRYWIQLFSHNRNAIWKGMLRIELNTPADDATALHNLQNPAP